MPLRTGTRADPYRVALSGLLLFGALVMLTFAALMTTPAPHFASLVLIFGTVPFAILAFTVWATRRRR